MYNLVFVCFIYRKIGSFLVNSGYDIVIVFGYGDDVEMVLLNGWYFIKVGFYFFDFMM